MRSNKDDFELHITANDIPKDLELRLTGVAIFRGNIVLRFADGEYGGHNPIISNFSIESLANSSNILEKKLINAGFEVKSAQKLITFIMEKILDKMEQGGSSSSSYACQTTFEGIEDNDNFYISHLLPFYTIVIL